MHCRKAVDDGLRRRAAKKKGGEWTGAEKDRFVKKAAVTN